MEDQLNNWEICRERVELLVSTLTSEMNKTLDNGKSKSDLKKNPLLVFRMGAITVIAANRLRKFGRRSVRGFITYDSTNGQNNILVCTGGTKALTAVQGKKTLSDDNKCTFIFLNFQISKFVVIIL